MKKHKTYIGYARFNDDKFVDSWVKEVVVYKFKKDALRYSDDIRKVKVIEL